MPLTPQQLQSLKADIAANANTIPAGQPWTGSFAGVAVSAVPNSADGNAAVAGWYSLPSTYLVWRTDVLVTDIEDNVTWANYTPQDVIPTDTALNTSIWQCRSLSCQGKQFNLEIMLQGRDSFNAGKPNLRGGLNDATTQLPSGAAGASKSGGWTAILPILRRVALNVEKLFAVASTGVGTDGVPGNRGTSTNPDLMVYEGSLAASDVQNARNS